MRLLASIFFTFFCVATTAQQYVAECSISIPRKNGFYKIPLQRDYDAFLSRTFSNLRISDDGGQQVPYIIETESEYSYKEFSEYEIIENVSKPHCCTNLIFENPESKTIKNIFVKIRNADVAKKAMLSGSDDQKNWYAVKDWFYLEPFVNPDNSTDLRMIDFPLSNYKYYLLNVNDSLSAPLNIVSLGSYTVVQRNASYDRLSNYDIVVSDSSSVKKTYLRLDFDSLHWIDRVVIKGLGTPYFRRPTALYSVHDKLNKKGVSIENYSLIETASISHEGPLSIDVDRIKTKKLLFVVDNGDNPTLQFQTDVFQLRRNVVAWLEEGKEYKLSIGDENLKSPQYDLELFKSKIPSNVGFLSAGPIKFLKKDDVKPANESYFQTKYLVWVSILAIIVILAIFSFRMIREAGSVDNTK